MIDFPVFDLHCDTSDSLAGLNGAAFSKLRSNNGHIDLMRASSLPGYAQCFACFTTITDTYDPKARFNLKLDAVLRELEANSGLVRQALSADDVITNMNQGFMSGILTIEGPAGFGFDPEMLGYLYTVGFRASTLGWNELNPLTGSHLTGGGLSELGREYVIEAQRVGMLIDVSHISDEGFWDIIEVTQAPIIASHSNSRAMCNVTRNLTDEMFLCICDTGGVAGINLYPDFLGDDVTLDTVCDHIIHFLELDPEGTHIALGGDLDGIDRLPNGFNGVQDYSLLSARLLERGLSEQLVMNIYWNNALGVFRDAVPKH